MPTGVYLLIGLLAGGVLGFLFGWLTGRGRAVAPDDRLANELRQQLSAREGELNISREKLAEEAKARIAAEEGRGAAEKLLTGQREMHEKALREAKEAQQQALADLRDTFKALSADALKQTAPEFLRLANETFSKFQETAKP